MRQRQSLRPVSNPWYGWAARSGMDGCPEEDEQLTKGGHAMADSRFDWDWDNAILVKEEITDAYVGTLLPHVLKLKQRNVSPITVGIDSVGGNLHAAEQLMNVLRSPNQHGQNCQIVTVAINKAFSAAATLLTLGDYAVAMPSAEILYNDVRYG